MKKLSLPQLTAILLCCFMARIMTYIPHRNENPILMVAAELISCAAEFAILLPAAALYSRSREKGVLGSAGAVGKIVGKISAAAYLLFCMAALAASAANFTYYLRLSYSEYFPAGAVITVLSAAAIYTASSGVNACGKTSAAAVIITIVGIIFTIIGFDGEMNFRALNMAVSDRGTAVWEGVLKIFSRSREIVFFILFLPFLKDRPVKTAASYLSLKFIISSLIIVVITIVLGDYAQISQLPFFTLSSYSKTNIVERYGALFLLFWTLCETAALAAILLCTLQCLKSLFPGIKSKGGILFSGAAAGAAAYILLLGGSRGEPSDKAYPVLLILAALPAVFLPFTRKQKEVSDE